MGEGLHLKHDFLSDILPQGNKRGLYCASDCLEEVDAFSPQLCVVMCIRIHLDSASVHNATQRGSPAPGVFVVEVVLVDDATCPVHIYDLDKTPSVHVNTGNATDQKTNEQRKGTCFLTFGMIVG